MLVLVLVLVRFIPVGKSTSFSVLVCITLIYLTLPGVLNNKVLTPAFLVEFKVLVKLSNGAEPAAAVVKLLAAKNERHWEEVNVEG